MSEKLWFFFSPISFETKLCLFVFTSTYLTLVLGFGAILVIFWLFSYIW